MLPEVRQLEQVFIAEFGSEFQLSAAGIVPEKAPERARALSLPFDGKLFYVPRGEAGGRLPPEQAEFLNYLAVWSPGYFVSAQHYEKDSWLVSILRPLVSGGWVSSAVARRNANCRSKICLLRPLRLLSCRA